jgi:hypothetical protein
MSQLTPAGQTAVQDIAQRHGFSVDAVLSMLDSVINGNGSLAQFSHPEFGGSGQWMQGGMTMIGDMFNGYLKGRVANLCDELSRLIASQPGMVQSGSFQSQSQNGNYQANGWSSNTSFGGAPNGNSLFAPPPPDWWGPDLKWPNSTGGQNGMRYAWFSQARRLAVESNGNVTIYDTLDHHIGGVSQQQSGGYSVTFTSQYGYVDLSRLPVVSVNGQAVAPVTNSAPFEQTASQQVWGGASAASNNQSGEGDIFSRIEKLADLQSRGILTMEEFAAKKAELLSRI